QEGEDSASPTVHHRPRGRSHRPSGELHRACAGRSLPGVNRLHTRPLRQLIRARKGGSQKPSTAAGETGTAGRLALIPDFAYDHTRHGYGGMQITSPAPMGVFDNFK